VLELPNMSEESHAVSESLPFLNTMLQVLPVSVQKSSSLLHSTMDPYILISKSIHHLYYKTYTTNYTVTWDHYTQHHA